MKKLLKQPFLWIGLLFVCLTAAVCVIAPKMHYSYGIVNKYEKAVKKNDTATLVSLFAPEDREEVRGYILMFSGVLSEFTGDLGDVYVGKMIKTSAEDDEEEEYSILTVDVVKEDGETDVNRGELELKKVDGKLYLDD